MYQTAENDSISSNRVRFLAILIVVSNEVVVTIVEIAKTLALSLVE